MDSAPLDCVLTQDYFNQAENANCAGCVSCMLKPPEDILMTSPQLTDSFCFFTVFVTVHHCMKPALHLCIIVIQSDFFQLCLIKQHNGSHHTLICGTNWKYKVQALISCLMSVLAFFPIMTVHPGFRVDCHHHHQTPDQQLMHCCFHKS